MLKKDVLKILTTNEAGKAVGHYPSYITRMSKEVPEQYKKPLINACRKKVNKLTKTLEQICKKEEK